MTDTFSSKAPSTRSDNEITLGWIGHATVLINFFGTWIITDPVFATSFGLPIPRMPWNVGPKRMRPPQLAIHELPPIDIILLSHGHMDHFHPYSCKAIDKHSHHKTQIIIAPGSRPYLSRSLRDKAIQLDWTDSIHIEGIRIQACEVKHRGARYPWEPDRSKGHSQGASYNAYLLQKQGKTIFFGGDTTYTEAMKSYAPDGGVDLAIMPIGSYDWANHHCNPEQALQMAHMLGSRNIVGIHRDARGRPAKREGDAPLTWLINSAPKYDMNVLWKYEGEVITL